MPRLRTVPRVPNREEFTARFCRVLESYWLANRQVDRILKDKAIQTQCALLLWFCVNDAKDRLDTMQNDLRQGLKSKLQSAIQGVSDAAILYRNLPAPYGKAHLGEYLTTVSADLRELQRTVDNAPPSLDHGRNLDWGIVEDARAKLSNALGETLSNATLAALLTAAYSAVGINREIGEDGVRHGLERARKRTVEHFELISRKRLP